MWYNRREAGIVVSLIHLRLNYLKWYFSVETAFVFFQFYEEKMEDQEGQLRMGGCALHIGRFFVCPSTLSSVFSFSFLLPHLGAKSR